MIHMYFLALPATMKFNLITAMNQLSRIMIKDELSLVICNASNDNQIILESASLPTGETKFKKFFKVLTFRNDQQHQMHICIGCNVISN